MDYQEMYRLPIINKTISTSALNLPIGYENGFMYKLPKIQGSLGNEDILEDLEARQESILKQLDTLKNRIEDLKVNPDIGVTVSIKPLHLVPD